MARVRSAACSAASSPRLWARDRWPGKKCHGATQKVEHKLALNADAEAFLKEVFSRLDKDGSGAVSKHELQDALKALNELGDRGRSATEAAADLSEMFPDEEEITEEQLAAAIFAPRERHDVREQLCLWLIMWVMPACYSGCTRLPFICIALEIFDARGGSLNQVGLVLGVYQTCRATANGIIGTCGGTEPFYRLYLPMVVMGLAGWVSSLFLLDEGVLWLLVLGGVGLSEVIVCLQSGLIYESNKDWASGSAPPKQVAANLRKQYIAVSGGSFIAYVAGGALYTAYGFEAICWFGTALQATQIISFALYVALARCSADHPSRRSPYEIMSTLAYQLEALDLLAAQVAESCDNDQIVSLQELAAAKLMVAHNHEIQEALGSLYDHTMGSDSEAFADSEALKLQKVVQVGMHVDHFQQKMIGFQASIRQSISSTQSQRAAREATKMEEALCDASHQILALLDSDGDGHVSKHEFIHFLAPRVYHAMFGSAASTVGIVWPYLRVVVVTQAVMALCIGSFLSTALLLYTQEFGMSAQMVGFLLGIGEGLGAFIIFLTSAFGNMGNETTGETGGFLQALVGRPLHVPLVLLIVGGVTMGFALPHVAVAIICQMIMSSLNDLSVTFLNELTATSMPPAQFKANHSLGQWLRRLGNMLTGVTGPILFGVSPGFPFLVYGGIVTLWACFLWRALYSQAIKVVPLEKRVGSGPVSAFKPFAGSKPFHQYEREYYFSHREELLRGRTSKAIAFQSVDVEHMLGRMRVKLEVEACRRQHVEADCAKLKADCAELKASVALLSAGRGENTSAQAPDLPLLEVNAVLRAAEHPEIHTETRDTTDATKDLQDEETPPRPRQDKSSETETLPPAATQPAVRVGRGGNSTSGPTAAIRQVAHHGGSIQGRNGNGLKVATSPDQTSSRLARRGFEASGGALARARMTKKDSLSV